MTLRNRTKMEELGIDANQLKGVLPNSIGNLSTLNLIDANFFFSFSLCRYHLIYCTIHLVANYLLN